MTVNIWGKYFIERKQNLVFINQIINHLYSNVYDNNIKWMYISESYTIQHYTVEMCKYF